MHHNGDHNSISKISIVGKNTLSTKHRCPRFNVIKLQSDVVCVSSISKLKGWKHVSNTKQFKTGYWKTHHRKKALKYLKYVYWPGPITVLYFSISRWEKPSTIMWTMENSQWKHLFWLCRTVVKAVTFVYYILVNSSAKRLRSVLHLDI